VSPAGRPGSYRHLRLACAPVAPAGGPARVARHLRAALLRVRVLLLNLVALCGAVLALAPLLLRRRPVGHRTEVPRRAARIIPLPPRRRASPP
jgi:hypothetical protein